MIELRYDVAVIGAGAAGMAAAAVTAGAGLSTLIIDREIRPGGVLRQCIHNGFGLRYFKRELTGPEFAELMTGKARNAGAVFAMRNTVTTLTGRAGGGFEIVALSPADGVRRIIARAVILAGGCRERCRGNLAVPGTRPAGIFTAGTAQRLINTEGMLPGRNALIVGSGDIGLIMARRLRWSGIQVKGVVEIMPHPSGLTRNVVQCLDDFGIPLWLSHSVINICGRKRVEGADIAPLAGGRPDCARAFHVDCDTVLFSVGLVPESELAVMAGVKLNPATGGAAVDANYETSVSGIFSAGNGLHVHDLVDFVAEEAERAAHCVVSRLKESSRPRASVRVSVCRNLKYSVPSFCFPGRTAVFAFRPLLSADRCVLTVKMDGAEIMRKPLRFVRPAEMISLRIDGALLHGEDLFFELNGEA